MSTRLGPGPQGLGAQGLGPGFERVWASNKKTTLFFVSEKSTPTPPAPAFLQCKVEKGFQQKSFSSMGIYRRNAHICGLTPLKSLSTEMRHLFMNRVTLQY